MGRRPAITANPHARGSRGAGPASGQRLRPAAFGRHLPRKDKSGFLRAGVKCVRGLHVLTVSSQAARCHSRARGVGVKPVLPPK